MSKSLKQLVLLDKLETFISLVTKVDWGYCMLICRLFCKEMDARIENCRKQWVRIASFLKLKYLQELVKEEVPKGSQTVLSELKCWILIYKIYIFYVQSFKVHDRHHFIYYTIKTYHDISTNSFAYKSALRIWSYNPCSRVYAFRFVS